MKSFIDKLATHVYEAHGRDMSKACVIFPNNRSGVFLKEALRKEAGSTIWLPEIMTIREWMHRQTGLQIMDNITLLFELYNAYSKAGGKDELSGFLNFGRILLNDFNELDINLVPEESFFKNLKDLKTMAAWELAVPGESRFLENYGRFWEVVRATYKLFSRQLLAEKKAYDGLAYRQVAEDIDTMVNTLSWDKLYFAGFSTLNRSEETILRRLHSEGHEILWDLDSYYLDDPKQEAGFFFRQYRKKWNLGQMSWIENNMCNSVKHIHIIGAPGAAGQAAAAGQILNKLSLEGKNPEKDTAVILGDEDLLIPLQYELPKAIADINITMGQAFKNTSLFHLIDAVLLLQENMEKIGTTEKPESSFYHKDVLRVLNHPYTELLCAGTDKVKTWIREKNHIFIEPALLFEQLEVFNQNLSPLFSYSKDSTSFFEQQAQLIELLRELFFSLREGVTGKMDLELEYLYELRKVYLRLSDLLDANKYNIPVSIIRRLYMEALKAASMPFEGEPLKGLQVMGMMESRTLDFKTIILTSMNEGVIPSGKISQTFIPFELRRAVNLPTYEERDSLFAYLFYRLIQKAENIFIIFNTENDDFAKGERSRFITQIQYELPGKMKAPDLLSISEHIYLNTLVSDHPNSDISIKKTPLILEKLEYLIFESGLSPSAFNTYINCSLQYYLKYIAGIGEEEEVEEAMESSTIGTAFHETMRELYEPFVQKELRAEDVRAIRKDRSKLSDILKDKLKDKFSEKELKSGKNYLSYRVLLKQLNNYLSMEEKMLEKAAQTGRDIRILGLEEQVKASFELPGNDRKKVFVRGSIDRIQSNGGQLEVIDYKTGKVEQNKLKTDDLELLFEKPDLSKALQLLIYEWLYTRGRPELENNIRGGIISLKSLANWILYAQNTKHSPDPGEPSRFDLFETAMGAKVAEMLDPNIPFEQAEDEKRCTFCSYKNICSRQVEQFW